MTVTLIIKEDFVEDLDIYTQTRSLAVYCYESIELAYSTEDMADLRLALLDLVNSLGLHNIAYPLNPENFEKTKS